MTCQRKRQIAFRPLTWRDWIRRRKRELADKLAEQADAVTSGLRDLLPDSKPIGTEEARPVKSTVEATTAAGEVRDEPLAPIEPSVTELIPTHRPWNQLWARRPYRTDKLIERLMRCWRPQGRKPSRAATTV